MELVKESFSRLFPGVEFNYEAAVSYSGRLKPYNATVRKAGSSLCFSLSRSWDGVSDEIVIGLIQHLLARILKKRMASTLNMQLYDEFIRNISDVAAVSAGSDEMLESSFARVNEAYFLGIMDMPNLRWGNESFRKLASYDYHTNSITVSSLFRDAPQNLLNYLLYHELLHKKLKFSSSGNGRAVHHSSEFRKLERNFEGSASIEEKLNAFILGKRSQYHQRRSSNWLRLFSFR